jgi:hypothetical protein
MRRQTVPISVSLGANPKPEGRNPKEIRNPKTESVAALETNCLTRSWAFRISGFGLLSAFGFRISDFGADGFPAAVGYRILDRPRLSAEIAAFARRAASLL